MLVARTGLRQALIRPAHLYAAQRGTAMITNSIFALVCAAWPEWRKEGREGSCSGIGEGGAVPKPAGASQAQVTDGELSQPVPEAPELPAFWRTQISFTRQGVPPY